MASPTRNQQVFPQTFLSNPECLLETSQHRLWSTLPLGRFPLYRLRVQQSSLNGIPDSHDRFPTNQASMLHQCTLPITHLFAFFKKSKVTRWTLKSTAEYRGFKLTAVSGHITTHAFPAWNLVFSPSPQQGDCLSSHSLHPEASYPPRSLPFRPQSSLRLSPSQAVVFLSPFQDKCSSLLCAYILKRGWLQHLSQ